VKPGFAVTGGMAKNRGVMDRLMKKIGIERMQTQWDTQIAGAVGAALFAYAMCLKSEGGRRKSEGGRWKGEVGRGQVEE
jgi:benzoyl-CoA reductase subunit A